MTCQKWEVKKTDYSSGRKRLNEDLDKIQSCKITYKAFLKKKVEENGNHLPGRMKQR